MVRQLVILLILSVISTRTLSEEVPEFQYPCYADVCTFPAQFCNSDRYERRCSPCSRSICRASNVPLACRYICMKHNELSTTSKPTTSTSKPQQTQRTDTLASLHLIMSYSAVSTTLLVVVLLAFVAYYIHRKNVSKEKYASSVRYRKNDDESVRLVEETVNCRNCRRPIPEVHNSVQAVNTGRIIAPPSYTSQYNDQQNPLAASGTESSSSNDSTVNCTKTQMVKPMKASLNAKMNNFSTNNSQTSARYTSVTDTASGEGLIDSLITSNTPEIEDIDETSRKSSVT